MGNRLDRLVTLTYSGEGCHDEDQAAADLHAFVKRLRARLGGRRFPYLAVRELHPGGHGYHWHVCVGKFLRRDWLVEAWGLGIVDVRRLSAGLGAREGARRAAGYVAKYVRKTFEETGTVSRGRHRYEVGQGFQVVARSTATASEWEAYGWCCEVFGGELPRVVFLSEELGPDFDGPPTRLLTW